MDLPTFRLLLELYGTALERWPDAGGDAALEFMASSAEAREAYLAAFSNATDSEGADDQDPALVERIMDAVARQQG
jgi:hypothetical protein